METTSAICYPNAQIHVETNAIKFNNMNQFRYLNTEVTNINTVSQNMPFYVTSEVINSFARWWYSSK